MESPQVQFLDKFNTPVVRARSPNVISSAAQRGDGIFASSTCHCNIITLVHVKILIVGNTGHLDNEID